MAQGASDRTTPSLCVAGSGARAGRHRPKSRSSLQPRSVPGHLNCVHTAPSSIPAWAHPRQRKQGQAGSGEWHRGRHATLVHLAQSPAPDSRFQRRSGVETVASASRPPTALSPDARPAETLATPLPPPWHKVARTDRHRLCAQAVAVQAVAMRIQAKHHPRLPGRHGCRLRASSSPSPATRCVGRSQ